MIPAARISAAIEVLSDIDTRRRPAPDALKDWGLSHRFAGSGDRAAIAGLVYDALRRRASSAFVMGETTPRAVMLGMLRLERDLEVDAIAKLFDGARFAPEVGDVFKRWGGEKDSVGAKQMIKEWMKAQPSGVAGRRQMPNFHLSDEQLTDLAEFLAWASKTDTQNWPPQKAK